MPPSSIADTADALRFGIARGYLGVADAIGWAREAVLGAEDNSVPLLGELVRAAGEPPSRILLILGQLAWGADPERVGRIAAGHLFERLADGRIEPAAAARAMYRLVRDGLAPDPEFETGARRFDELGGKPLAAAGPSSDSGGDLLRFLSRYGTEAAEDPGTSESERQERDHLSFSIDRPGPHGIDLMVFCRWQVWAGRSRLTAQPDPLAAFASELSAFATHGASAVRLELGGSDGPGRVELTVTEYGRARRAAVRLLLREAASSPDPAHAANGIEVIVPTEHELLGEFAADLAELLSTGNGVARLRLLRRWPVGA